MPSGAKKGSVRNCSLSPLSRREGRKRNKSFPLQGGTQRDTSVTTWDQLMSLPAVENFCFFLPSLLLRGDRLQSLTDPIFAADEHLLVYVAS